MTIPGSVVFIHPTNKNECNEQLADIHRSMARATIPDEYIRAIFDEPKHRVSLKRLREKVISDGYQLMLHIEDALVKEQVMKDHLWQQKAIIFWNHLSLSISRMNDYIQEHKGKS